MYSQTASIKNILLLVFFQSMITGHLNGQPLPEAVPEEVGLSTERLNRIAKVMDQHVEEGYIAGSVTMVARKGRLAWHASHGLMNIEEEIPMEKDAIFQIASMAKPMVPSPDCFTKALLDVF